MFFVMAAYRRGADADASHQRKDAALRHMDRTRPGGYLEAMTPRDARNKAMREVWALNITHIRGKAPKKRARGAPAFTRQARA
jgi:hypothetical protein